MKLKISNSFSIILSEIRIYEIIDKILNNELKYLLYLKNFENMIIEEYFRLLICRPILEFPRLPILVMENDMESSKLNLARNYRRSRICETNYNSNQNQIYI